MDVEVGVAGLVVGRAGGGEESCGASKALVVRGLLARGGGEEGCGAGNVLGVLGMGGVGELSNGLECIGPTMRSRDEALAGQCARGTMDAGELPRCLGRSTVPERCEGEEGSGEESSGEEGKHASGGDRQPPDESAGVDCGLPTSTSACPSSANDRRFGGGVVLVLVAEGVLLMVVAEGLVAPVARWDGSVRHNHKTAGVGDGVGEEGGSAGMETEAEREDEAAEEARERRGSSDEIGSPRQPVLVRGLVGSQGW